MPTVQRILAGQKSKSSGAQFENILEAASRARGWGVTKHPSGCKRVWTPKGIVAKDVPTAYDFTFFKAGTAIFIDAKSVSVNRYAYSMMTAHQVAALCEYEREGFAAGYVVEFRELQLVVFFKASQLSALKPKESLGPDDGLKIGTGPFNIDISLIGTGPLLTPI